MNFYKRLRFFIHNRLFYISLKVGSSLRFFNNSILLKKLSEVLNDISNKGFSVVTSYYQPEEIDSLNILLNRILDDIINDSNNEVLPEPAGGIKIFAPKLSIYPQLQRYCFDKLLLFVGFFFYQKIKIPSNLITITHDGSFKHPAVPGIIDKNKPMNWEKHIDTSTHYLKGLILLEDINIDNGPTGFLSKSNKSKSLRSFLLKNYPKNKNNMLSKELFSEVERQSKLKLLTGKKGDLILVDTSNVHWASALRKGVRKIIWLYF